MPRVCGYCGLPNHSIDECSERLEDKFGLPSDYEDGGDVKKRTVEDDDEEIRTDGGEELVTACPECDSANFSERTSPHWPTYLCQECRHEFDEPVERPKKIPGSFGPAAQALIDADPDDLGSGGSA